MPLARVGPGIFGIRDPVVYCVEYAPEALRQRSVSHYWQGMLDTSRDSGPLRLLLRIVLRLGSRETEGKRGCCGVAVLRREREGRKSSARCRIVGGAAFAPQEDDQLILVARKYTA